MHSGCMALWKEGFDDPRKIGRVIHQGLLRAQVIAQNKTSKETSGKAEHLRKPPSRKEGIGHGLRTGDADMAAAYAGEIGEPASARAPSPPSCIARLPHQQFTGGVERPRAAGARRSVFRIPPRKSCDPPVQRRWAVSEQVLRPALRIEPIRATVSI